MKNIIQISVFAAILAVINSTALYGQQYYIGLDAGYGLKINSPTNAWNTWNTEITETSISHEITSYSLGQGFQAGLSVGYMFNENMGIEAGIAYQNGVPVKSHFLQNENNYSYNVYYKLSAQSVRVSPALIIQMKPQSTLSPYMKMGLICAKASIESNREDENEKTTQMYSNGFNLGVTSSLGAIYNLSDKLALVGEFKIQLLNFSPKKRVLTEYTISGVDQLPGMTTSEIEVEYLNSYDYDSNNPPTSSEPVKALKELFPLNSFGFNIGLRFNL